VHLVQILLPVFDANGVRSGDEQFVAVRRELTGRFGGVTAYLRSPASGLWVRDDGAVDRDDVVMVEVMVERIDRAWWRDYRKSLEQAFRQDVIVVRAFAIETL
jgi:hypothetical protein